MRASFRRDIVVPNSSVSAFAFALAGFVLICSPAFGQMPAMVTYTGMCDASAAVALDADHFAVADDEDTRLHIYPIKGGAPVRVIDLAPFLKLDPKKPEIDLEGAIRIGDRIYWISSHGRNREGKARPSRLRFFATCVTNLGAGVTLRPVGTFYGNLLNDLFKDPRLKPFRLDLASRLAPKLPGGLNIEGLSATPDGHLLIGFRNPVPRWQALIVPLLNPDDLVQGKPARFGDPILLDLGGLSIRAMGHWQGKHFIVAGKYDARPGFRFYHWSGGQEKPELIEGINLGGINAEALVFPPNDNRVLVLSDDGTMKINGSDCKKLKDASQKRFRGVWIEP